MKTIIKLLSDIRSVLIDNNALLTTSNALQTEVRDLLKQLVEGDKEVVGLEVTKQPPTERP